MLKKSQSRIFMYAFALLAAALVLLFGYRAIYGVGKQAELSRLVEVKADLEADISEIALQFGTSKRIVYTVPGFVSGMCFYAPSDTPSSSDGSCSKLSDYPLVKDSVEDGSGRNVFILGERPESLFISGVDTGICPLRCFKAERGSVQLLLEGRGNSALLLP